MMRSLALIAALALAAPAAAQDQSLADVRNELAQLSAQLQSLRSELVASGAQGMQAAGSMAMRATLARQLAAPVEFVAETLLQEGLDQGDEGELRQDQRGRLPLLG